ncbi:hypothetical protein E2562_011140 [Oryza meyeriana var. granulata]|uniref:Core Histone H2A/H2B/H3 domain-containing protein n=1 Tax=Oryza meyeriana var. granulata TaxID=110450 RepID=A0A6G1DH20_9ORYZ|nr:hypothetical protein E2562_011140 [Oryza meyeriana var. granulata]
MAPKQSRRTKKKKKLQVVASVVKTRTKVVQETVQVTAAELDSEPPVSGSTLEVEVELDGSDAKTATATATAEQKETPVVPLQSQETQDPREYGGYKRYVWRVLKQVHPNMGASGRTMEVLDMMMADMFERLAEAASRLSKVSGRATLTSREVQSAVRLVLPGDLANHAISEGTKAISNYLS